MIVFSEILVNSAIFTASISDEKYHKISLNLASEILERTIYLFLAQDKLKTFKGVFLKESASTRTMILSMKNKYIYRSWISEKKFREILKYFAQDIEATKIANLTGISRISVNKILKNIRILMASECEKISKFSGEISKPA